MMLKINRENPHDLQITTVENWTQSLTFFTLETCPYGKRPCSVTAVQPPLNDHSRGNGFLKGAGRLIEVKTIEKPSSGLTEFPHRELLAA